MALAHVLMVVWAGESIKILVRNDELTRVELISFEFRLCHSHATHSQLTHTAKSYCERRAMQVAYLAFLVPQQITEFRTLFYSHSIALSVQLLHNDAVVFFYAIFARLRIFVFFFLSFFVVVDDLTLYVCHIEMNCARFSN